ncbi:MAG: WbqC family protein [Paludibacteraceae bacterium]|nr:WbqC family protein [Paludibacteraceae bacterium]
MNDPRHTRELILPSAYFPPVDWLTMLLREGHAVIPTAEHFHRQTLRNRTTIGGANGALTLSVPVEHPAEGQLTHQPLRDVRIAYGENWQRHHWQSIVSAYRHSPFFPFLDEDFRPLFEKRHTFLLDLNTKILEIILRLLDIKPDAVIYTDEDDVVAADDVTEVNNKPYYQVFADRHGFQPHLSILDLLFNMGNEARLVLKK